MDIEVYILVSPLHVGSSFSAPTSSDKLTLAPLTPRSLLSLQLSPAHLQWPMNSLVCIGVPTHSGGQGARGRAGSDLGASWSELGVSWEQAGSELGASWSEASEPNITLGFRVPTTIGGKTSIITYSAYVSPPPGSKVHTQCPFT